MQEKIRRSNIERTQTTRAQLLKAARQLFVEKSYAETSTPEVVAAAGVTRGALYHHFADKQALFRAVVEEEAKAVAAEIDRTSAAAGSAREELLKGAEAFIAAMQAPGRTRLLLIDGPAVLGRSEMNEIDARHSARTLRAGLEEAMKAGEIKPLPLDATTALLSSAFDRAALAVEAGAPKEDYGRALDGILTGIILEH